MRAQAQAESDGGAAYWACAAASAAYQVFRCATRRACLPEVATALEAAVAACESARAALAGLR
jgi:hypothetical protein